MRSAGILKQMNFMRIRAYRQATKTLEDTSQVVGAVTIKQLMPIFTTFMILHIIIIVFLVLEHCFKKKSNNNIFKI